MSNFPGESTDIPKRLLDSMDEQPLSHLIPKTGLLDIIDSTRGASIPLTRDAFPVPLEELLNQPQSVDLESKKSKYIFRRPKHMDKKVKDGPIKDLMEGLSPLAKQCLAATNCDVSSQEIQYTLKRRTKQLGKRNLENGNQLSLEFNSETHTKKMKVESNVTINRAALANRYIEDLMAFLDEVQKDSSAKVRNIEHWVSLPNNNFVLTEQCIAKLQLAMNNILSAPKTNRSAGTERIVKLLDILVVNIKLHEEFAIEESQKSLLNRIAHASVPLIFTSFLLEDDYERISLERYVLTPLDFIANSVKKTKLLITDQESLKTELSLLHQSILLLPKYISQRPFLDKGLITRLIYIFTDVVMDNELETAGSSLSLQYCKDNLKSESINILISLFAKLPDQRELIIEELLSNIEKLPTKRVQKRLRKIDNDVYVTDFTVTVLLLLENVNCYDFAKKIAISQPELFSEVGEKHLEETNAFHCFANQITESIFDRVIKSTSNYRHVLENYVQDLLVLLPYPQWIVAQDLLVFMMRKLLLAFDPSHPQTASIETICLHLLGSIGLAIFEIKCGTESENANNLVKLFNSPNDLPHVLKSFEKCSQYIERKSANKFLWNKKFGILLKLDEYATGTNGGGESKTRLASEEIKNLAENVKFDKTIKKLNISDVKSDYYSILHAFDLLNMYEPYLKLILSILGRDKIKLKSTAIKCLSMLATADQKILNTSMVKSTIAKTLKDSSASVKDAVLDLISIGSSYLEYYQQLNTNYDDESVLIRKHVLKINGNIYDKTDSLEVKTFVMSKILLKIEDEEDNIIEIARTTLLERWILAVQGEENLLEEQSGRCNDILFVMSGVATMNSKCSQLFEWYLNFFLLNKQLHTPNVYEHIIQSLNKLTDHLVQDIVELQSNDLQKEKSSIKERLLILLSKFADCSSTFITKDHITSLYPYIVSDEKSNMQFNILHVFNKTIQGLSNFKPKFLFDLETTLLSRLPRMSVKEVGEAMPLIWCVATNRKETGRVTKACSSCFQHMSPYINKANKSPESITVESKLQRLIYLSAAFARFCKFPNKDVKPLYVQDDEPVHEYVAKCLLLLSRQGIPHVIRRVSIKALTQLCGDHPKLFNSKHILNLLDEEFESSNLDIKLVILESLYDFFMAEERKSIKQTGVNVYVSSNLKPKTQISKEKITESISSDSVCAALVTRFLKHLLKICLSEDIRSSLVAVRLLKLILQYGYANPSHCIPTVIGLVGSTNQYLHGVAVEVLTELFERYETMVFAGMTQGVKVTIEYSKTVEGMQFYKNNLFLKNLQKIVGDNKKYSTKFFKSLVRTLQIYFNQTMESDSDSETKDGILFLSNNIALIKFSTQYELISLLKTIDLESDQLKEAIIDAIERKEVGLSDDKLRNIITIQTSLEELKNYLIRLYGVKVDLLNSARESELKNKPLSPVTARSDFGEKLELVIARSNKEDIIHRYAIAEREI